MTDPSPEFDQFLSLVQALRRYRSRLARTVEAMRGDLAEAKRATEYRTFAEALLTYIKVIPPRASRATLPDPLALERRLEIPLDPRLRPQENAARYFKLAAKAERGL